ncbi:hypothetical protein O181_028852 [Austropuccinia psidii MF-1]|uniref:Uncharacterized protein n=1 Tax=Austropuccinia psidii MF-1 TaxID=1389203 RepID=A0A9Q3CVF5_9BASI|nr:hypothetical protein [Austropuccinia psidii MF-1]
MIIDPDQGHGHEDHDNFSSQVALDKKPLIKDKNTNQSDSKNLIINPKANSSPSTSNQAPPLPPPPTALFSFKKLARPLNSDQKEIFERFKLEIEQKCKIDPIWENERDWLLGHKDNSSGLLHALISRNRTKDLFAQLEKAVQRRRNAAIERNQMDQANQFQVNQISPNIKTDPSIETPIGSSSSLTPNLDPSTNQTQIKSEPSPKPSAHQIVSSNEYITSDHASSINPAPDLLNSKRLISNTKSNDLITSNSKIENSTFKSNDSIISNIKPNNFNSNSNDLIISNPKSDKLNFQSNDSIASYPKSDDVHSKSNDLMISNTKSDNLSSKLNDLINSYPESDNLKPKIDNLDFQPNNFNSQQNDLNHSNIDPTFAEMHSQPDKSNNSTQPTVIALSEPSSSLKSQSPFISDPSISSITCHFLSWTQPSSHEPNPLSAADILELPPIITSQLSKRFFVYQTNLFLLNLYKSNQSPIPDTLVHRCHHLKQEIMQPWEQLKDKFLKARSKYLADKEANLLPDQSPPVFMLPFMNFSQVRVSLAKLEERALNAARAVFQPTSSHKFQYDPTSPSTPFSAEKAQHSSNFTNPETGQESFNLNTTQTLSNHLLPSTFRQSPCNHSSAQTSISNPPGNCTKPSSLSLNQADNVSSKPSLLSPLSTSTILSLNNPPGPGRSPFLTLVSPKLTQNVNPTTSLASQNHSNRSSGQILLKTSPQSNLPSQSHSTPINQASSSSNPSSPNLLPNFTRRSQPPSPNFSITIPRDATYITEMQSRTQNHRSSSVISNHIDMKSHSLPIVQHPHPQCLPAQNYQRFEPQFDQKPPMVSLQQLGNQSNVSPLNNPPISPQLVPSHLQLQFLRHGQGSNGVRTELQLKFIQSAEKAALEQQYHQELYKLEHQYKNFMSRITDALTQQHTTLRRNTMIVQRSQKFQRDLAQLDAKHQAEHQALHRKWDLHQASSQSFPARHSSNSNLVQPSNNIIGLARPGSLFVNHSIPDGIDSTSQPHGETSVIGPPLVQNPLFSQVPILSEISSVKSPSTLFHSSNETSSSQSTPRLKSDESVLKNVQINGNLKRVASDAPITENSNQSDTKRPRSSSIAHKLTALVKSLDIDWGCSQASSKAKVTDETLSTPTNAYPEPAQQNFCENIRLDETKPAIENRPNSHLDKPQKTSPDSCAGSIEIKTKNDADCEYHNTSESLCGLESGKDTDNVGADGSPNTTVTDDAPTNQIVSSQVSKLMFPQISFEPSKKIAEEGVLKGGNLPSGLEVNNELMMKNQCAPAKSRRSLTPETVIKINESSPLSDLSSAPSSEESNQLVDHSQSHPSFSPFSTSPLIDSTIKRCSSQASTPTAKVSSERNLRKVSPSSQKELKNALNVFMKTSQKTIELIEKNQLQILPQV